MLEPTGAACMAACVLHEKTALASFAQYLYLPSPLSPAAAVDSEPNYVDDAGPKARALPLDGSAEPEVFSGCPPAPLALLAPTPGVAEDELDAPLAPLVPCFRALLMSL